MNDLTGKACVVTGSTAGMGLYTLTELARMGARVIGIGRSPERCEKARESVLKEIPKADVTFLTADLSSQQQIKNLSGEIMQILNSKGDGSLYCLINNAGTFASRYTPTVDGIETQLAVNYLAPFLLTHLLFPALEKQQGARILTVSSESHYKTFVNWRNVQLKKCYVSLWAYKQSKLFTVLFMRELDRRIKYKGLHAFAVDPGLVATEIGFKGTDLFGKFVWHIRKKLAVSVSKGAATAMLLASRPDICAQEIYWRECRECKAAHNSYNKKYMRRVWDLGEKLCRIKSEDYGIHPY